MPMTFDEFRAKYNVILSEQQEAAVRSTEQNTLLLAVPGSGKTTVLVTRIGYMLYACDIMPERILTMTYTNAATYDMIRRFESKFGDEFTKSKRLEFRTINGICAKIILFYEYITKAEPLRLLSNEKEIASILGAIYRGITNSFMTENDVKQYRLFIARIKNEMLKEAGIQKLAEDEDQPDLPKIYKAYQEELARRGAMDYDDQMVRALQILRENPNVLVGKTRQRKRIFHPMGNKENERKQVCVMTIGDVLKGQKICVVQCRAFCRTAKNEIEDVVLGHCIYEHGELSPVDGDVFSLSDEVFDCGNVSPCMFIIYLADISRFRSWTRRVKLSSMFPAEPEEEEKLSASDDSQPKGAEEAT